MTFFGIIRFTAQGAANVRDTVKRANAFKNVAKKMGVKVQAIYWTLGPIDGLLIVDAPDEETATAAMLHLSSLGFVRAETTRAYKADEAEAILAKLPS